MSQSPKHKTPLYTAEEKASLDIMRIPQHIAIIPDGNRRWAKKNRLSVAAGHSAGADLITTITQAAQELGVKVVTCYGFSTENWSRNPIEVTALFWLLESYLTAQRQILIDSNIRFQTIGDLSKLPTSSQRVVADIKQATAHCNSTTLVLALNYGGRDEIRRAIQAMVADYSKHLFREDEVTETLISRYLDTAAWKDPDLLIRTGGEQRMSNFLLWQTSYTELSVSELLWPDFTPKHLLETIVQFQKRERRLGGT